MVSIDAEKLFNKIHASQKGKKKLLSKLRIEMNFISLIRDTEKGFNKIQYSFRIITLTKPGLEGYSLI